MNVTEFADRAISFVMTRLGVLPSVVVVRSHPPVVMLALGGRLAGYYGESDEGPFVVVVAAGRSGKIALLGKVADADELERALVDHPDLDNDEVSWILSDLRAARLGP